MIFTTPRAIRKRAGKIRSNRFPRFTKNMETLMAKGNQNSKNLKRKVTDAAAKDGNPYSVNA